MPPVALQVFTPCQCVLIEICMAPLKAGKLWRLFAGQTVESGAELGPISSTYFPTNKSGPKYNSSRDAHENCLMGHL